MPQDIAPNKVREYLIHFGGFTLNLERRGLYRGDDRIHLTSKPLETLIFLVENSGRTIEKQHLLDAVWKDAFVTEDTLVHAIREIRRALEDDKENPRFIQTVPRQGYRFVCRISSESDSEEPAVEEKPPEIIPAAMEEIASPPSPEDIASPSSPIAEPKNLSQKWVWTALAAIAVSIPLLILLSRYIDFRGRTLTEPPLKQPAVSQLTSEVMGAGKPAFSSEGNILYISQGAIHVRLAAGDASLQITDVINPSGDMPVFTADGSQVVFSIPRNGEDGSRSLDLFKVDIFGGPPKLFIKEASGAGFSPNGKWVAYTKYLPPKKALWISPVNRLEERIEITENGYVPRWSPDGRWLAYTTSDPNAYPGILWIASVSVSEDGRLTLSEGKQLIDEPMQMYGLAWSKDSSSIIFAARSVGPMHLYMVPISGGALKPLTAGAGDYVCPSVSPDGGTLIFWYGNPVHNLAMTDRVEGSEEQFITQDEYHLWPRLSPSGERLVSATRRPDNDEHLYMTDLKTMKRTRLSDRPVRHPSWIDEENVAYLQDSPSGDTEVRVVNITTGVKLLLTQFSGKADWLAVHPDKRRLAVVSKLPNGKSKIVLRDLDKQSDVKIAEGAEYECLRWVTGGSAISWSGPERPSGTESNGIWIADLDGSEPRRLVNDGYGPVWSADGMSVYYSKIREYAGLWRFDLQQKGETKLRNWKSHDFYDFDVVGRRLIFTESGGRGQIYSMSLVQ